MPERNAGGVQRIYIFWRIDSVSSSIIASIRGTDEMSIEVYSTFDTYQTLFMLLDGQAQDMAVVEVAVLQSEATLFPV